MKISVLCMVLLSISSMIMCCQNRQYSLIASQQRTSDESLRNAIDRKIEQLNGLGLPLQADDRFVVIMKKNPENLLDIIPVIGLYSHDMRRFLCNEYCCNNDDVQKILDDVRSLFINQEGQVIVRCFMRSLDPGASVQYPLAESR